MQKSSYSPSQIILQLLLNIFILIVFVSGGCILGFWGGLFIADFKHSLQKKALEEWHLLDGSVRFTQLAEANDHMLWAKSADGKLYFWNFSCGSQQACNQWVETKNILYNSYKNQLKKNNICSFPPESSLKPFIDPPGKIIECGMFDVTFYALLEDGKIWYWHWIYPGDGLPNEVFISTPAGILIGALIAIIGMFYLQVWKKNGKRQGENEHAAE